VTASIFALAVSAQTPAVLPGIETFLADVPAALRGKRVALITNHTGIDRSSWSRCWRRSTASAVTRRTV
jgi:uncharacterized protein YbbC (DUF1343 family)